MLELLSRITNIPNLHADPQLYASGLAQGGNRSFLNVHIDNSSHPVEPWYRRLNLLVYFNHVARSLGGDEFGFILPNINSPNRIASPFKGFLDLSIVSQKMRKLIQSE